MFCGVERIFCVLRWMRMNIKIICWGLFSTNICRILSYDLIYDEKPETLKAALEAYKEALQDESAEELKEQIKTECHYVIEPELTYTYFADAARNNSFNREGLQKAFNNIEQSDPLFADLFTDIDLYSNRLRNGDSEAE